MLERTSFVYFDKMATVARMPRAPALGSGGGLSDRHASCVPPLVRHDFESCRSAGTRFAFKSCHASFEVALDRRKQGADRGNAQAVDGSIL